MAFGLRSASAFCRLDPARLGFPQLAFLFSAEVSDSFRRVGQVRGWRP